MADDTIDKRVLRTRHALGGALMALVTEKPFDTITVQDVLDRAGVSRSTFYSHYSNKDDLFLSDAERFFELMTTSIERRQEASRRVAPVRELFAHVADVEPFYDALAASGRTTDLLELGRGYFARSIDRRLAALPEAGHLDPTARAALSHACAAALFSLLEWWMAAARPQPPEAMDALFHGLVWSGLARDAGTPAPGR